MNINSKQKIRLVIFNFIVSSLIVFALYHVNYIDFHTVRTVYMPIIGVCIISIFLDYVILGQVFIVSAILGLIAEYTMYTNYGINALATGKHVNSTITIVGFSVGFIMQMYLYKKTVKK